MQKDIREKETLLIKDNYIGFQLLKKENLELKKRSVKSLKKQSSLHEELSLKPNKEPKVKRLF